MATGQTFTLLDYGSIVLLCPIDQRVTDWIEDNVLLPTWFADGLVVEPRYVEGLLCGLRDAGLCDC